MRRWMQSLLLVLGATLLAACGSAPPAAPMASGPPKNVLWVGNSFFYYNNSLHGHFGRLATSGQSPVRSTSVTISGSGLDWHDLGSMLGSKTLGSYSFVGDNEIRFNPPGRQYDTVVMMDCSQCPLHPQLKETFHASVKSNAELLRANGVRPVLFMSWAYKDKPEMTQQLAAEYVKAGQANRALVVPAGLAFAESVRRRPDLELYVADKRHPTLAGTYLAACTVMASVYKKSPVGNRYTAGLSADIAAHLQAVAWETAQSFHAKEGRGSL